MCSRFGVGWLLFLVGLIGLIRLVGLVRLDRRELLLWRGFSSLGFGFELVPDLECFIQHCCSNDFPKAQ